MLRPQSHGPNREGDEVSSRKQASEEKRKFVSRQKPESQIHDIQAHPQEIADHQAHKIAPGCNSVSHEQPQHHEKNSAFDIPKIAAQFSDGPRGGRKPAVRKVRTRIGRCQSKHDEQGILSETPHTRLVPGGPSENFNNHRVAGHNRNQLGGPVHPFIETGGKLVGQHPNNFFPKNAADVAIKQGVFSEEARLRTAKQEDGLKRDGTPPNEVRTHRFRTANWPGYYHERKVKGEEGTHSPPMPATLVAPRRRGGRRYGTWAGAAEPGRLHLPLAPTASGAAEPGRLHLPLAPTASAAAEPDRLHLPPTTTALGAAEPDLLRLPAAFELEYPRNLYWV